MMLQNSTAIYRLTTYDPTMLKPNLLYLVEGIRFHPPFTLPLTRYLFLFGTGADHRFQEGVDQEPRENRGREQLAEHEQEHA